MQLHQFTLNKLVVDPDFIQWVKNPGEVDGQQWLEWSLLSDDNFKILTEAKAIILAFCESDEPSKQELNDLWDRIVVTNEEWDKKIS